MKLFSLIFFAIFVMSCQNAEGGSTAAASTTFAFSGDPIKAKDYKDKAEHLDVQVQIDGLSSGMLRLIGTFEGQNYMVDSAMVDATGKAVFKKNEAVFPGLYFLLMPDKQTSLQVLLDLDQTVSLKTTMANLAGAMQVEGSLDNQLLYGAMKFEDEQRPKFNAVVTQMRGKDPKSPEYQQLKAQQKQLGKERMDYLNDIFQKNPKALFTAFKQAGQNPEVADHLRADGSLDTMAYLSEYRSKFWDNVNFNDERLLYTPVVPTKLRRFIKELTIQHPDSVMASANALMAKVPLQSEFYKYFANWITLDYDPKESKMMDSEAVWVNMIQKYFTKENAFWSDSFEVQALQLRAYEMAASLIGKPAPDVKAPGPDKKLYSIYDIKSPYIVVYMYNPDCEHCAVETPKLATLYNEWKSKGMEVYGIAIDTDDASWKAYIAKEKLSWTNVHDPTNKSIYAKYFVDVTPEIYLVNPDRKIIAKNLHVDQIVEMIQRDMKKRK